MVFHVRQLFFERPVSEVAVPFLSQVILIRVAKRQLQNLGVDLEHGDGSALMNAHADAHRMLDGDPET